MRGSILIETIGAVVAVKEGKPSGMSRRGLLVYIYTIPNRFLNETS